MILLPLLKTKPIASKMSFNERGFHELCGRGSAPNLVGKHPVLSIRRPAHVGSCIGRYASECYFVLVCPANADRVSIKAACQLWLPMLPA